jgi:hypothetical protein
MPLTSSPAHPSPKTPIPMGAPAPKPPGQPVTLSADPGHDGGSRPQTPGEPLADTVLDDGDVALKPPVFDAAVKPAAAVVAPKSRAELRRLFLEQSAITLGQSWADQWRDDLRREGRPAAGGWPGTLREARVRVEHHLLTEVTRRKMSAVTEAEREVAARKAYASARAQWCRQAEPEAP